MLKEDEMNIIKEKIFEREYKKKIVNKNKTKEINTYKKIENLILDCQNLKELLLNPLSNVYKIEKKSGNLKEIYTANLNYKIRLYMKPIGEYLYNQIKITEIEFFKIDDKHYGEG